MNFSDSHGIWTQMHNIPLEAVSEQGIAYMAGLVGTPMSDVQQGVLNGRVYLKVKISHPINENLKDSITVDHPTLGPLTIPLVYEKLSRVCFCCGGLGHEIQTCETYAKIMQLAGDPKYSSRPEVAQLKNRRKGAWMTSVAFVPRPTSGVAQQPMRGHDNRGLPTGTSHASVSTNLADLALYESLETRGRRNLRFATLGGHREHYTPEPNHGEGILGAGNPIAIVGDASTPTNSAKRHRAASQQSSPADQ